MNDRAKDDTATVPAGVQGLTIRPAEERDRLAWAALYRGYADFYGAPMDEAILRRTWSWLMSREHPVEGFVAAMPGGLLVGLAHYRPFPEPLLGQDAGYLDDLFVLDECRGLGVGRCLIDAVAARARDLRWPVLRWITAHDNIRARHLYDGLAETTGWVTYDLTTTARRPASGRTDHHQLRSDRRDLGAL